MKQPRVIGFAIVFGIFLLFSTNRILLVEAEDSPLQAKESRAYNLDFDKLRSKPPRVNLKSALLANFDNGEVLFAKDCEQTVSIASISKLISAMVLLDSRIDMNKIVAVTKEDARNSSRSHLRSGWEFSIRDLLTASLLVSDNRATRALARAVAGTLDSFAVLMNHKAAQLGLANSVFYEPTGLDPRNVSTAREVALILHHAYNYPAIAATTSLRQMRIKIANKRNRYLNLSNTNRFVGSPFRVLAGKTGYIAASDYCLATLLQNQQGERLTLVVLGAPGKGARMREARKLAQWGFTQL